MTTANRTCRMITARAKVWSGKGITQEKFVVEDDGTVRVYDPVANHYTTCHSMSAGTMARIRRLAR